MAGNDERRYGSQEYAGDVADRARRGQAHMPQEDRSERHEIEQSVAQDQAASLASEVRMGDDRVVIAQNWANKTSTQLHAAATEGNSPGSADNLGRGFNEGGNRLTEAANRLYDAVSRLESAWQGKAASAAHRALTPLAASTGQAGVTAQYMGTAMSQQAAAAAAVRTLPEPVEFDATTEMHKALANPNPIAGMADMAQKANEARAVKHEQVTFLNNYTQSMSTVDASTPSFVPPKQDIGGGGGGGTGGGGGGVHYRGPGGGIGPGGGSGTGGEYGYAGPGAGGRGNYDSPNPPRNVQQPNWGGGGNTDGKGGSNTPIIRPHQPGDTSAAGYTPPSTTPPMHNYEPPGYNNPQFPNTTGNPGGGPYSGTGGPGPFGSQGGIDEAGGRGGARGPMSTEGRGTEGRGPGARVGAGFGAAEEAGMRGGRPSGGAAGAGRGTPGGMGGGSGHGEGDEDTEHQRPSYLIEPDPEETFGTDQITAPPVIGE